MSTWQGTARKLARRLVLDDRNIVLAGAAGILVVVGVIATIVDGYAVVLLCILALQAVIVAHLLTAPQPAAGDTARTAQAAVDRSSARTLADIAHARQSILDAIAQLDSKQIDPQGK